MNSKEVRSAHDSINLLFQVSLDLEQVSSDVYPAWKPSTEDMSKDDRSLSKKRQYYLKVRSYCRHRKRLRESVSTAKGDLHTELPPRSQFFRTCQDRYVVASESCNYRAAGTCSTSYNIDMTSPSVLNRAYTTPMRLCRVRILRNPPTFLYAD